jgi:hypothetical protein
VGSSLIGIEAAKAVLEISTRADINKTVGFIVSQS